MDLTRGSRTLITIKLQQGEWKYDPSEQLGPEGGFGVVFAGSSDKYGQLAIKKLKIGAKEAAHRELEIAKELANREFVHVMPVLDSGQDAQSHSYFVVMPRAEGSLQDELERGSTFNAKEAAKILSDIAQGLSEVQDIVHRDLKPANVLFHEGKWKVSDFGIARFVEQSTSLRTLKGNLTPEYAAPEQWQYETATSATDIYALGCIGCALIAGQPPFQGPATEQLRYQHLNETPAIADYGNPKLQTLLLMMLKKPPMSRPDIDRVKRILAQIGERDNDLNLGVGLKALAQAGADAASDESKREAERKRLEAEIERRKHIAENALKMLSDIIDRLFDRICGCSPAAKAEVIGRVCTIHLGQGRLCLQPMYDNDDRLIVCEAFPRSKWDVVAGGQIDVHQGEPRYEWSASLWYSKLPDNDDYRWREVSYFGNPLVPKARLGIEFEPFALRSLSDADEAVSPVMGVYQVAFGPVAIDEEDFDAFCDRWAGLLAKAAQGRLEHPRVLPLR